MEPLLFFFGAAELGLGATPPPAGEEEEVTERTDQKPVGLELATSVILTESNL